MPQRAVAACLRVDVGQRPHAGGAVAHPDAKAPLPVRRVNGRSRLHLNPPSAAQHAQRRAFPIQHADLLGEGRRAVNRRIPHGEDHIARLQRHMPAGPAAFGHDHHAPRAQRNAHCAAAGDQQPLRRLRLLLQDKKSRQLNPAAE